ncbi:MAG: hypothetical protein JXR95_02895 [Deltaproteobacteria bacterium]|nr:hypothetical protein [Deltaproteobacteria bacterium]
MYTAHGKAILLGEHSVLYGSGALCIPLKTRVECYFVHETEWKITINDELFRDKKAFGQLIKILEDYSDTGHFSFETEIPPGAGLGFSAAISNIFSQFCLRNSSPSLKDINSLSYRFEQIFHKTPSGLDNTAVTYNSPVFVLSQTSSIKNMINLKHIHGNFYLTDINPEIITGFCGSVTPTSQMVETFRGLPDDKKAFFATNIDSLISSFVKSYTDSDMKSCGQYLTESHRLLCEMKMSSPQLDEMVEIALEAGAWGAKMTGGGGGGCVISMAPPSKTEMIIKRWAENGYRTIG